MDQSQFEALTGISLKDDQSGRYDTLLQVATAELEELLGWPLGPTSWTNLYNETGKTQDECPCPDVDTDSLEDPDEVIGTYRLYDFKSNKKYLAIDPATAIHKVKLVKDDITFRTYETKDIRIQWRNGAEKTAKYIELCDYPYLWYCRCLRDCHCVQLAVDANWAYEELPLDLQKILADMIGAAFTDFARKDIKTESRGSHSYTKFDKQDALTRYPALRKYAGPNGSAYVGSPL